MSGANRTKQQDRRRKRQLIGETQLAEDKKKEFENDLTLDWFMPVGLQIDCVNSFEKNSFSVVDGVSGCGKTSVALWWALNKIKTDRSYHKLIFIKNPTEVGDDQIGFLSGDENDKLMAHMDTTKRIFQGFVSKNKLENDISKDRIRLTIPNFLLGTTFDNSIIIIDECQTMSPKTIKLLTERCGKNSKYILLGDGGQRYSVKSRADGFSDFIERVTVTHQGVRWSKHEPYVGYVKMNAEDNQRSSESAFINRIYEDF